MNKNKIIYLTLFILISTATKITLGYTFIIENKTEFQAGYAIYPRGICHGKWGRIPPKSGKLCEVANDGQTLINCQDSLTYNTDCSLYDIDLTIDIPNQPEVEVQRMAPEADAGADVGFSDAAGVTYSKATLTIYKDQATGGFSYSRSMEL